MPTDNIDSDSAVLEEGCFAGEEVHKEDEVIYLYM
jgi:hypothetical protein